MQDTCVPASYSMYTRAMCQTPQQLTLRVCVTPRILLKCVQTLQLLKIVIPCLK